MILRKFMSKPQLPPHIYDLLVAKRDHWIKQMAVDKFSTVEIAFVFNLTKSRISQIINEPKGRS